VTRTIRRLGALLATAVLLAGCSDARLDSGTLEKSVASKLGEQTGQRPDKVSCPGGLEAKTDATTRCTLTASDGSTIGATVRTTKVDGDHVDFFIQVDDRAGG
jgi:hypothetical protein